jgi:hypothetical protein
MNDAERNASDAAAFSKRLEEVIAIVDTVVVQIRTFAAGVTQPDSERRPAPDAWSIGEILHHLVLVIGHAGTLPKMLETQPPDQFDYSVVIARRRFTLPDIADPAKSGKGVAPERVRPRSGGDIQTLTDELVRGWEESKARLRSVAGRDLSRHYFEHYRLGPLNIYETIAFQGYHAQKHLDQMKRTLTEISTSV